jgi:hypothetical protein
MLGNL